MCDGFLYHVMILGKILRFLLASFGGSGRIRASAYVQAESGVDLRVR